MAWSPWSAWLPRTGLTHCSMPPFQWSSVTSASSRSAIVRFCGPSGSNSPHSVPVGSALPQPLFSPSLYSVLVSVQPRPRRVPDPPQNHSAAVTNGWTDGSAVADSHRPIGTLQITGEQGPHFDRSHRFAAFCNGVESWNSDSPSAVRCIPKPSPKSVSSRWRAQAIMYPLAVFSMSPLCHGSLNSASIRQIRNHSTATGSFTPRLTKMVSFMSVVPARQLDGPSTSDRPANVTGRQFVQKKDGLDRRDTACGGRVDGP